jgi:hypothetical protein
MGVLVDVVQPAHLGRTITNNHVGLSGTRPFYAL